MVKLSCSVSSNCRRFFLAKFDNFFDTIPGLLNVFAEGVTAFKLRTGNDENSVIIGFDNDWDRSSFHIFIIGIYALIPFCNRS